MRARGMSVGPSTPGVGLSVQILREEFDSSFQKPRASRIVDLEALLLIRVCEASLALRLTEVGGLHECPPVTRVPSPYIAQLGLVGLRSRLVTAYSLSAYVARDRAPRPGRWMALWAKDRSIGFVFDQIEGYVHVQKKHIRRRSDGESRQYGAEAVRIGEEVRSVLDVSAVVDTIRRGLAEANS